MSLRRWLRLQQAIFQGTKCPPAMTDAVLFLTGQLRPGLARRRVEEYGIVAEAAVTPSLMQDAASPDTLHGNRLDLAFGKHQHCRAVKPGAALLVGHTRHFPKQLVEILRIRRGLPGIPGRPDARAAIESIDRNARVVRHCRQPGSGCGMPSLYECVVGKGRADLLRRLDAEFALRHDGNVRIAKYFRDLVNLSGVVARENEL